MLNAIFKYQFHLYACTDIIKDFSSAGFIRFYHLINHYQSSITHITNHMKHVISLVLFALICQLTKAQIDTTDYQRAEKFLSTNLSKNIIPIGFHLTGIKIITYCGIAIIHPKEQST